MNNKKHDFAWHIVDKRKIIEKIFAFMVLISLVMMPFVPINYDLTSYLPSSAPSGKGLELMKDEFGFPGTAQVMIEDVSLGESN